MKDDSERAAGADRQAILTRRAIFVTTALTAVSCSSQGGEGVGSSTVVEPPRGSASAAGSASASLPSGDRAAKWKQLMTEAPPLGVADSLKGVEREELDRIKQKYEPVYESLRKAFESANLDCAPKSDACNATWKSIAKALGDARESKHAPHCGYGQGVAFIQRDLAHGAYIEKLAKALEEELADGAMKLGDATSWPKMVQEGVAPQPCLKCAMQTPRALTEGYQPVGVPFADGKSSLELGDAALKKASELATAAGADLITIRGHADPSEQGDRAALAKARAEAVRDWLVKNGVPAARLVVAAFASDVPIASGATETGRATNRRVDFQRGTTGP